MKLGLLTDIHESDDTLRNALSDFRHFDCDGLPNTPQKVRRVFGAIPHRLIFAGHYHQWLLASEDGIQNWQGERPIQLSSLQRHFVVINALCDGYFAVFDTDADHLVPLRHN